jgi:hypothetical protein
LHREAHPSPPVTRIFLLIASTLQIRERRKREVSAFPMLGYCRRGNRAHNNQKHTADKEPAKKWQKAKRKPGVGRKRPEHQNPHIDQNPTDRKSRLWMYRI